MVLYNIGCKIIVKKQENILRLLIVEDEKQICDMVAKSLYAAVMRWIPVMMGKRLLNVYCRRIMI